MDSTVPTRRCARRSVLGLAGISIVGSGLLVGLSACGATPAASPSAQASKADSTSGIGPTAAAKPAAGPTEVAPKPAAQAPATMAARQKLRLRLDFLIQGQHAPFYLAQQSGWYRDNGLDVEIIEGNGSGPALQLLANKSIEFGFVDSTLAMSFIGKDVPIRTVAGIFRSTPQGFLALGETPLTSPKDLEGKTLALVPATLVNNVAPTFFSLNGVDASKVKQINTEISAKLQLLLAKKVEVMQGAASDAVSIQTATGKDPSALWLSDWGMTMVGYGITTHTDLIKEQPETVRQLIAATLKGFTTAREQTAEAVAALRKAAPDVKTADPTLKLQLESWFRRGWDSKNSQGKPAGYLPPEDFDFTQDELLKVGMLTAKLPIDRYFTNEFLPN